MAHESFEDPTVAAILNEHFIPIKVDREERPDVDALYMAATQLVSGHGGWPMSVFLAARRTSLHGRHLLSPGRTARSGQLHHAVERHERRVDDSTRRRRTPGRRSSRSALEREVSFIDHLAPFSDTLDLAASRRATARGTRSSASTPTVDSATRRSSRVRVTSRRCWSSTTRTRATRSSGRWTPCRVAGLYDHLRGGFARYSVDAQWHVPHFEKMLSDQALLARAYLRAAKALPEHGEWREVALDTIEFVLDRPRARGWLRLGARRRRRWRRRLARDLDARRGRRRAGDRWRRRRDLDAALRRWRIETPGAFEGRSIPRLADGEPFATPDALTGAREALRRSRAERIQPGRDEKVILEWNAMFASALFEVRDEHCVARGVELLTSLSRTHFGDGVWWRTESHRAHASASDVAWMLDACVDAFEATGDDEWLELAGSLAHVSVRALLGRRGADERDAPRRRRDLLAQRPRHRSSRAAQGDLRRRDTLESRRRVSRARAMALCTRRRRDARRRPATRRTRGLATRRAPRRGARPGRGGGLRARRRRGRHPGDANELSAYMNSVFTRRAVLVTGTGSSPLLAERVVGSAYVCRGGVCQLPGRRRVTALAEQLRNVGA